MTKSKADLKVVPLYPDGSPTAYKDTVKTLRKIARDIATGKYGAEVSVALVMYGDEVSIFGVGRDSSTRDTALMLHEGAHRMMGWSFPNRGEQ